MREKNKKNSYIYSLVPPFLIFLTGCFLRFYQLGEVPVGFHRDEAYFGYNAYSLLMTARDMSGNVLPLHLQSFLYSPAGYSYFSIPFIAFFGLSEFSVRFASAFFGSFTILLVYFLVRKLFREYAFADKLALISSLFLAISPWHINLSRVATENVLVVFVISLGIFSYLIWVDKKKFWTLLVSFLCFSLTLFLYQAPRSFLPFFIPLLVMVYGAKFSLKRYLSVGAIFLITIILPICFVLLSPQLSQRINMLSIFKNPQTQLVLNEQIREDGVGKSPLILTRVFHNKYINYTATFSQNYFKHFSYDFLFNDSGLPDRYRVPQMGLLYFFDLVFILFGIWGLFSINKKIAILLSGWVLLA